MIKLLLIDAENRERREQPEILREKTLTIIIQSRILEGEERLTSEVSEDRLIKRKIN